MLSNSIRSSLSFCNCSNINVRITRGLKQHAKRTILPRSLFSKKEPSPPFQHLVQVGDPVLREKALPVNVEDLKRKELQNIIELMVKLLKRYSCSGIAAPQIGISAQIFVARLSLAQMRSIDQKDAKENGIHAFPLKVCVNPEVKIIDSTPVSLRENCCSFHGYSAVVPRYKEVVLKAFNEKGEPFVWVGSHWTSRIIQHEVDHLNGVMYTDRMDSKTLALNYWRSVNNRGGKFSLNFSGLSGPLGFFHNFNPFRLLKIDQTV